MDPSGNLIYYEKMDNTQLGGSNVAIDKAGSAALFKRPTKAFQDALAAGGRRVSTGDSLAHGWKDCWCDRRFEWNQCTGCAMHEGRSGSV